MIADELRQRLRTEIKAYFPYPQDRTLKIMIKQLSEKLLIEILNNFELKKRGG